MPPSTSLRIPSTELLAKLFKHEPTIKLGWSVTISVRFGISLLFARNFIQQSSYKHLLRI